MTHSYAYFHSDHYRPISWATLMLEVAKRCSRELPIFPCRLGLAIIPQVMMNTHFACCDEHFMFDMLNQHWEVHPHLALNKAGLEVLSISGERQEGLHFLPYFLLLCELIVDVLAQMIRVTDEHLMARFVNEHPLGDNPHIQQSLGQMWIELDAAKALLCECPDHNGLYQCFKYFESVLLMLTHLGGARSMLCGHAVELRFHLTCFKQLYLSPIRSPYDQTPLSFTARSLWNDIPENGQTFSRVSFIP